MSFGSSPKPPDPYATAQAQSASNRDTALAQAQFNMVDQVTPFGNLTHYQVSPWSDGSPRFKAVTQLSPEQQRLLTTGQTGMQTLANAGAAQAGAVQRAFSQPVNLNNAAVENRLFGLASSRLAPVFQQRRAQMETQLANQGIARGSEQWQNAFRDLNQRENDAYVQTMLSGRQQGVQEILAQRTQPLNELNALLSGTQVSQPQFTPMAPVNVAPTDVTGAVYGSYGGELQNANRRQSAMNAAMGGLFGLGGSALGGWAYRGFT